MKKNRNPYVLPMTLRNKKQVFHDRREERGGSKNEQSILMEEIEDCAITLEESKNKLEAVEARLAERFNLHGDIRSQLIEMDKNNLLVEDELVADWHDLYSWYMDWLRHPS